MHKKILAITFCYLFLTFEANAAALLEWLSVDLVNPTLVTTVVTPNIGSSPVPALQGNATITVLDSPNPAVSSPRSFLHTWVFKVTEQTTDITTMIGLTSGDAMGEITGFDISLDDGGTIFSGGNGDLVSMELANGTYSILVSGVVALLPGEFFSSQAYSINVTATPIPAAVWLFGSALLGISGLTLRRKPSSTQVLTA